MKTQFPILVILAGGASSRLWPLRDKSLLKFMDQTLLERQIATYAALGFREIAVICNPGNRGAIQTLLEGLQGDLHFHVVVQTAPKGMGDALLALTPLLQRPEFAERPTPVYICQVHDIFDASLHATMLRSFNADPTAAWIASYQVNSYFPGGYLTVDDNLVISNIVEKPGAGKEPSNLVNIVAHMHPDLHQLLEAIRQEYAGPVQSDDHYERAMAHLMRHHDFKAVPYTGAWCPVKYPWHVLDAMNHYLAQMEANIRNGHYQAGQASRIAASAVIEPGAFVGASVYVGERVTIRAGADVRGDVVIADDATLEDGVHVSGPAYIGKGVRLLHGADIRGPVYLGERALVGQYANVRQAMVARRSIIGASSEVNRSYVGEYAMLHAAMVLDSVLADSEDPEKPTNMSARVVTANLRADRGNVKSTVKEQRLDTQRNKLGAIVGSGAFVAVNVMLMPGIKIGENCFIGPTTVVAKDIPDGTRYYVEQTCVAQDD